MKIFNKRRNFKIKEIPQVTKKCIPLNTLFKPIEKTEYEIITDYNYFNKQTVR